MLKVNVGYFPKGYSLLNDVSYQDKSFKTEEDFIIWYDRNYEKIGFINDEATHGMKLSHMKILGILRK